MKSGYCLLPRAGTDARRAAVSVDLSIAPTHLVRRVQQISHAIFAEEISEPDLTPAQFSLLVALHRSPGVNQITLSRLVGIDRSTIADVVRRLRDRGLVARARDSRDARRNTVRLTHHGASIVERLSAEIRRVHERLLAPLESGEQADLIRLLTKIVAANDPGFPAQYAGDGNAAAGFAGERVDASSRPRESRKGAQAS
jgi:DNA-binding MarR family transcriptional regulator